MGKFLENAWYVAGWSDELGREPMARRLLDRDLVFFRREDGLPLAMTDRCPHRFVPLSAGTVVGDEIQCPYHGLKFGADGKCYDARVNETNRDRFCLATYPLVERYGSIWIWMGDPAGANPADIPDFSFLESDTRFVAGRGTTHMQANYLLEIDNLLDLSHLDFVHPTTLSNGAIASGAYKVWQDGKTVHSDRIIRNTPAPVQFLDMMALSTDPRWDKAKADKIVDLWLDMHWYAPSTLKLDVGVGSPGLDRANRLDQMQAHYVTPESETSTHYFWIYTMTKLGQSQEHLDGFLKVIRKAFEDEDKPMLELQQRAMKSDFWTEQPMVLEEDAGAIRARRIIDKLVREEAAARELAMPQAIAAE
ncbi:MAG: aromatic ring-hydroxylating dioxygenase subunit alpha [Sphingomonas bacterium]|nr:aromatic ring-hydroxylating dioxygenase subunit alpha [Sphingomonas bacterium]MDB5688594.1 aromatic ring-hydroxylating dioxygenase subunit alpha [Sphingomonas bacterium]